MNIIPIEVSARHVHLSAVHVKKLFGYNLTSLHPISQSGQFAAKETVQLLTTHYSLATVRIVGPARKESQVELALSDCRILGLKKVPVKVSGSLKGTPGITLVGPKGKVVLKQGVIIARRHIHCPLKKAKQLGLRDGQIVNVRVKGRRGLIFDNVIVRVRPDFVWRMHIDTDEANAAGIVRGGIGIVER